MKRKIYTDLLNWKRKENRKPLMIQGARQVGKTYIVKEFGKSEFDELIYLNFERDDRLKSLFEGSLDSKTLLESVSLYSGVKIVPGKTLIFFDEIQETPRAITSLKYFYEESPEYHIIAAGSLLGVQIGKEQSFPVGKVEFLHMYPMDFVEFLMATDNEMLAGLILEKNPFKLPDAVHEKMLYRLKRFLFVGGMPEVVDAFRKEKDVRAVTAVQQNLLQAYKRDFSKYATKEQAVKTSEIWNSVPYQLARESKKFKYGDVKKKARASYYQSTIEWLKGAGLIYKIDNVNTPKLPLAGYADRSKFKIYLFDTGLLCAMLNLPASVILEPLKIFEEFYGAFIENYVAAELIANGISELFYWTSKSDAEVDFLLQLNGGIVPLEVKSGTNRHMKSLRSYDEKYHPEMLIRSSPRNFEQRGKFLNLPLYWVSGIEKLV